MATPQQTTGSAAGRSWIPFSEELPPAGHEYHSSYETREQAERAARDFKAWEPVIFESLDWERPFQLWLQP